MATSPEFLKRLEAEWPVKMANEIVIKVADKVKKLQRKAFSAVTTRVQSQKIVKPCSTDNGVNVGINKLQPLPKDQGPTQTVGVWLLCAWWSPSGSVACQNYVELSLGFDEL